MAVPSVPVTGSRALYVCYTVPAPTITYPVSPPQGGGAAALNNGPTVTPSNMPPDCGPGGQALAATVLSVSGGTPDYPGMLLAVHTLDGQTVLRRAGFASGQPLLSTATWTTNGSPTTQAHWQLMDALA